MEINSRFKRKRVDLNRIENKIKNKKTNLKSTNKMGNNLIYLGSSLARIATTPTSSIPMSMQIIKGPKIAPCQPIKYMPPAIAKPVI